MRYLIKISLFIIIMSSVFCGQSALGGKLYKWVDEKGDVHFSDRKPDCPEELNDTIEESYVEEILPVKKKMAPENKPSSLNPIQHTTNSTFTIKGSKNLGTGFFISSNGYAVTCKHVIEEGQDYMAVLNNRNEFPVGIISISDLYDLALVLVITPQKTPYLSVRDTETLIPGERVFAIGSSVGLQSTVTDGIFTGLRRREGTENNVIQFSAPVNPGNSGGPLIDKKGKVIGVVSWKIISKNGIPISGVGFAIPSGYLTEEFSAYIE